MKDLGKVQGSKFQAQEIIINVDTVYVHSNIEKVEDNLYEYDEVQYGKDEFIKKISEKNKVLEQQITEAQLAMAELVGMMGV